MKIIEKNDGAYPQRLRDIETPPERLYCKGDASLLSEENLFAVVGTRNVTRYGADVTKKFCDALVGAGVIIVSGLARGVDSIAHRAALDAGRPTVAVLGCGFDHIYPPENKELYKKIEENGLLVSEYPPHVAPALYTFPARNRILSGISMGVLATEGGVKSGSLITLRLAEEQGKDVFVVPGNITQKQSRGTNEYLRTFPEAFVIEPDDILRFYGLLKDKKEKTAVQLDMTEQMIVNELENEEKHIEELKNLTNLNMQELSAVLTSLEIRGVIQSLAGNFYAIA